MIKNPISLSANIQIPEAIFFDKKRCNVLQVWGEIYIYIFFKSTCPIFNPIHKCAKSLFFLVVNWRSGGKTHHLVTLSCAVGYYKNILSYKKIEPSVLNFQCGFAQMKYKFIITSSWLCYSKATNKSCLGLHSLSPQIC